MKVTVCELPDARRSFDGAWASLVEHVGQMCSDLVLLPQMPFSEWFLDAAPDAKAWAAAVRAHDEWEHRLPELAPALVLGTRPVDFGNERYEEAFAWDREIGMRSIHANCRPSTGKSGSRWFAEPTGEFVPFDCRGASIGFLIGGELWMQSEARRYGQEGVNLIAIPRSNGQSDFTRLLEGACADAAASGAYVLSSNRSGAFGGRGWVIAPDGRVLHMTSESAPFLALDIELPTERLAAESLEPHPAPAYIDPWETGVPPF